MNIGVALKNLIYKKQFTCYRCLTKGATVQCGDCHRAFHGYYCSQLYMLQGEGEETEQETAKGTPKKTRICMFCQNKNNFESYSNVESEAG
jgi:hypothetical protein